jgi:hypothetical protein
MHDPSLQRIPFHIQEQVVTLVKAGFMNRHIFAKVKYDLANTPPEHVIQPREGTQRTKITVEDVNNIRRKVDERDIIKSRTGKVSFPMCTSHEIVSSVCA